MKPIKKLCSNQFTEADLSLIRSAPALYDTLLTVMERIEKMDPYEISDKARKDLVDIQAIIWDTINADGDLCGISKWADNKVKQICRDCGCTETGDSGFCSNCGADGWVEADDLDNPRLKDYVKDACKRLNTTKEELKKRFI